MQYDNAESEQGQLTARCGGCKYGTKGDCKSNIGQCVWSHVGSSLDLLNLDFLDMLEKFKKMFGCFLVFLAN